MRVRVCVTEQRREERWQVRQAGDRVINAWVRMAVAEETSSTGRREHDHHARMRAASSFAAWWK